MGNDFLGSRLSAGFLPAILGPAPYLCGDGLHLEELLGVKEGERKLCHKTVGHSDFSGYLHLQ